MKKTCTLFAVIAFSLFVTSNSSAQSTLIHYWNFNNYTRNDVYPDLTPIKADYSIIDTNKAQIVYQAQAGMNPTSYDGVTYLGTYTATDTLNESVNLRNGDSIGNAVRVANPSDSLELLFYIPSTNYQNLRFKFISYPSSTTSGQKVQLYDYSVDSGMTWKTTGLSQLSDTFSSKIWRLNNLTFGADSTVNNNPKLVFRIRFSLQTTGASGNNRFDNVTLDGDTLTANTDTTHSSAVAQVTNNISDCKIFPNPAGNDLDIATTDAGDKTFEIYTVAGQKVFSGKLNGNQSVLNVSMLKTGMYYITIRTQAGITYSSKFVKS